MLYEVTDKVQLSLNIKAKSLLSLNNSYFISSLCVSMTPLLDQLTFLQYNKV